MKKALCTVLTVMALASHPATAIIVDRTAYLVDAGEGVWRAAAKAAAMHGGRIAEALELTQRPTRVFLTHLHSDHTVGLPNLMLLPWVYGKEEPLEVYGPPGTENMVAHFKEAFKLDIENRVGRSTNDLGWRSIAHDIEAAGLAEAVQGADVWFQEIMTEENLPNAPWGGDSVEEKKRTIWGSHMKPSALAKIATDAKVGLLVLYHEQNYSDPDALIKELRSLGFEGAVVSSRDADVF